MLMNEVVIFKPNSRKKEATISSPMQSKVVDALEERMGADMAKKTRSAFNTMGRNEFDALQFKFDNRRIKIRQVEA